MVEGSEPTSPAAGGSRSKGALLALAVALAMTLVGIAALPSSGDATESTVAMTVRRARPAHPASTSTSSRHARSDRRSEPHVVIETVNSAAPFRLRARVLPLGVLAVAVLLSLMTVFLVATPSLAGRVLAGGPRRSGSFLRGPPPF